jgi:hypothetical protein
MREQNQLLLEALGRLFEHFVGLGGAIAMYFGIISGPIGWVCLAVGIGLEVHATIGWADWAQRWGDLQMRIKRYQYRKAFGEDWQEYWPYYYLPRAP